jgi:hypothetical protein
MRATLGCNALKLLRPFALKNTTICWGLLTLYSDTSQTSGNYLFSTRSRAVLPSEFLYLKSLAWVVQDVDS